MKIYIWGTGRLAGKVVGVWIHEEDIVAYIDNDINKKLYMGKDVISPNEVLNHEYDAIVVATLYSTEIEKQCNQIGININKVIFLYNSCILIDLNKNYDFVTHILGEKNAEILRNRHHIIRGPETEHKFGEGYYESDYVRIKTFELAVKEIRKKNVPGAVAEVGVFKGEFAHFINASFPDKKCYLFDTFEGFDANEALQEKKRGNCGEAFIEAYKHTNLEIVLERMPNIDMVNIKQGYFPESLEGMEEDFAFVSVDVDFEKSIYKSLEYFYPRLNKGGYIFVHDYNSSLVGVEKAVDDFERNNNIEICKFPVCDANGTLVITK